MKRVALVFLVLVLFAGPGFAAYAAITDITNLGNPGDPPLPPYVVIENQTTITLEVSDDITGCNYAGVASVGTKVNSTVECVLTGLNNGVAYNGPIICTDGTIDLEVPLSFVVGLEFAPQITLSAGVEDKFIAKGGSSEVFFTARSSSPSDVQLVIDYPPSFLVQGGAPPQDFAGNEHFQSFSVENSPPGVYKILVKVVDQRNPNVVLDVAPVYVSVFDTSQAGSVPDNSLFFVFLALFAVLVAVSKNPQSK